MAALKGYFPQALEWAGDLTKPMAWAFLRKWPTLDEVKAARKDSLLKFYHAHHVRRGDLVNDMPAQVQDAVALVRDPAIIETSRQMVESLCKLLQAIQPCIDQHSAQIKELFARHPERHLFDGLPGAGPVLAPRLLAAFGGDRTRFQSAKEISQLSGIAPVTERSGKSTWVHWRWAASAFLRQTFHEFASHSIGRSAWAKATYEEFRARGQNHHAAVRMLAYKWIRILYRCWQSGTPYDEEQYIAALRTHGSPIALKLHPKEA
jgi:transposase